MSRVAPEKQREYARAYAARNREYYRDEAKKTRDALREAGICMKCRTAEARPGKAECQPCVDRHVANMAARAAHRKERGRCVGCNRRKFREASMCLACTKRRNDCKRRRRGAWCECGNERHIDEHACALCLTLVEPGAKSKITSRIVSALRDAPRSSVYDMAEAVGVTVRTCLRVIKRLKALAAVRRYVDEDTLVARYVLLEAM